MTTVVPLNHKTRNKSRARPEKTDARSNKWIPRSAKSNRPKQLALLKGEKSAYGGDLLKTRAGRKRGRPISTRETMHLVLRSTQAKGEWSFKRAKNEAAINRIVEKFSVIYGVRVLSLANVGNHLHMQVKFANRFAYAPFIRAITGAIAMAITGRSRWTREGSHERRKFWDYRPFTRVVQSLRAFLKLKDYIRINELEGFGYRRDDAQFMLKVERRYAVESG